MGSSNSTVTAPRGGPTITLQGRPLVGLWPWLAVAVLVLISGVVLWVQTRGLTVRYDEWQVVVNRRGDDLDAFFAPHVAHLIVVPVLVYKALFATVGLEPYSAMRAIAIGLHLLTCVLLFVYAIRRTVPVVAVSATAILLFGGEATSDLVFPFWGLLFIFPSCGAVAALLLLDRQSTAGDVGAGAALLIAVASQAAGLAVAVGLFVELCGRRLWRRLWLVLVPVALYAIWWLIYSPDSSASGAHLLAAPHYLFSAAAGTAAGLTGSTFEWGRPLAVLMIAGVGWTLARRGTITPRQAGLGAMFLSFWALVALTRDFPDAPPDPRYLYPAVLFALLFAVEFIGRPRLAPWATGAVVVFAVLAVGGNLFALEGAARDARARSAGIRATLGVFDIANQPQRRTLGTLDAPVDSGQFAAARGDIGDPGFNVVELGAQSDAIKFAADRKLVQALGIAPAVVPASASREAPAPLALQSVTGDTKRRGACAHQTPAPRGGAAADITLTPPAVLYVRGQASTSVRIRRFAALFLAPPVAMLERYKLWAVRFPPDRAGLLPWIVRVSSSAPLEVCSGR